MTAFSSNKHLLRAIKTAVVLACMALASPGGAQEPPALSQDRDASPWVLGIALGQGRRDNPFVASDDYDVHAVLDLAWYGERFFFDNGDLGVVLKEAPDFSINALATFDNERNYFSYLGNQGSGLDIFTSLAEGPALAADIAGREDAPAAIGPRPGELPPPSDAADYELPERDFAVNGGLEFLHISAWGDLQAQFLSDLSGTHNGHTAWLSYSYPWFTESSEFAFSVGAEWKSSELVDYYYGVRPEEALPGRPAYSGGSGVNGFLRFSASRSLSRHWKLVSVAEREYLDSAISASPVIDTDTADTFFVGLYYRF